MARSGTASERHFRIYESNPWRRFRRDLWVFLYLAKIVLLWLRVGGRLRRELRRAKRDNRPIVLDRIMGGTV
ncbi:MAG: hypothetical protein AB7P50_20480 [Alphaproteobacteria bacterium]